MLKTLRALAIAAAIGTLGAHAQAQTVITQWDFDAIGPVGPVDDTGFPTPAPFFSAGLIYNSPSPTTGNGFITPLGMDNNYTFATNPVTIGSVTSCDVLSTSGLGASAYTISTWRVRGPSNAAAPPGNGNGWNRSAPERTQGAQFSASTVNFTGIHFSCQFYSTTQGVSTAVAQYTLDGSTWSDFGSIIRLKSNDYLQPADSQISASNPGINLDFSAVSGANNNPNFGVRLVSVYDPNYAGTAQVPAPSYASAAGATPPAPNVTPYNNSSGNWRFGLVTFTGTSTGPINPVIRASTDQTAVCANVENDVVFRAVVQPGLTPASTNVQVFADLSSLGLSNHQPLAGNDDSTFFTFTGSIPANTVTFPVGQTAAINRTVSLTVIDAQGRSAASNTSISFVPCNAVNSPSTVVISQVYGGGGKTDAFNAADQGIYESDYIELYNRSASPVNLNGWSVQYASPANSAGFSTATNQVNLAGVIQPSQYFLVRFSDPSRGFVPLPAPDFSTVYSYGGLGNTGGRVALSDSIAAIGTSFTSTHVKDLVGYGAAAITFEGAGPAPTPDNAHAVIRKSTASDAHAGAQDTNQNFYDFALGYPTPHNRASNGTTSFLTAYASLPNNVPNSVVASYGACAGTTVSFNVAVTPGSSSSNIGVTADISPITGTPGTIQLFDDGPAGGHGDAFAGDGVYTLDYTIPASAAQGVRNITFTAADAQSNLATSTLTLDIGNCVDSGTPITISQIFGGGAHFDYVPNMDYAQIYNRSSAPVDLTGWNLQYADANGDFLPTKTVTLSGMIGPGEYRLIAPQPIPGIGLPIPTPDFSADLPGFGFDNHFARVAIVKPIAPATTAALLVSAGAGTGVQDSRGLVDLVGYGSATPTYEGVAPAGTLANGTYLVRKNNGAQDFNQNLLDFDVLYILAIPETTRTLTVQKTGSGHGTVTTDLPGINCGGVCSATFDRDTVVTLTATPTGHSTFRGWSGGPCTGTMPCTLPLSGSTTITATFGCAADFNNDGVTSVQDIFSFLSAWFAGTPNADFNGSGTISVQDIFDFLSAWFTGC